MMIGGLRNYDYDHPYYLGYNLISPKPIVNLPGFSGGKPAGASTGSTNIAVASWDFPLLIVRSRFLYYPLQRRSKSTNWDFQEHFNHCNQLVLYSNRSPGTHARAL